MSERIKTPLSNRYSSAAMEKKRLTNHARWLASAKKKHIYEVKSPLILQPGPAALTDGLDKLVQIFSFGDHGKS